MLSCVFCMKIPRPIIGNGSEGICAAAVMTMAQGGAGSKAQAGQMQVGRCMGVRMSVGSSFPVSGFMRRAVISSEPWLAIATYYPMMAKSLGTFPPVGTVWHRHSPPSSCIENTAMLSWPRLLTKSLSPWIRMAAAVFSP